MVPNQFRDDSRQYLQMLQNIIDRMAANSSNCKQWMIAIFTAMTAMVVSIPQLHVWAGVLALIVPDIVFYLLDSYYLSLEKEYRDLEAYYIRVLHSDEDCSGLIYIFDYTTVPGYRKYANLKKGLLSYSTWILYLFLGIISVTAGVCSI